MADSDDTKPVQRTKPFAVDPARIDDDPTTNATETREALAVGQLVATARAATSDPNEALRWLALAYCALAEDSADPAVALTAGAALIRQWRDAGLSMPAMLRGVPLVLDGGSDDDDDDGGGR